MVKPGVERGTVIFDLTGASLANFDYTFSRFMIHTMEAYYPESLGHCIIWSAPWIFQGAWRILSPLLDPVVHSKVHFCRTKEDLFKYIAPDQLQKRYGGKSDYEYEYIPPKDGENALFDDDVGRDACRSVLDTACDAFESASLNWNGQCVDQTREDLAERIRDAWHAYDPYVRARTVYHRSGYISKANESCP